MPLALAMTAGGFAASLALSIADAYTASWAQTDYDAVAAQMSVRVLVDRLYWIAINIFFGGIILVGVSCLSDRGTILTKAGSTDRVDLVRGPDENGVVWIGQSYADPAEANAVADRLRARIKGD
jgi:hypothetical protein